MATIVDMRSGFEAFWVWAKTRKARAIQRRGRTGRSEVGKVVVLVTEDSRDEAFLYAEMGREKKMKKIVRGMADGEKTSSKRGNRSPDA